MKTLSFIMRVCKTGGLETVLYTYLKLLRKKYHLKVFFLSDLSEAQKNFLDENEIEFQYIDGDKPLIKYKRNQPIKYIIYKIKKLMRKADAIFARKRVRNFIKDSDILVDFNSMSAYMYIRNIKNCKKILFIHGGWPFVCNKIWDFSIYDKVVVLTDSLREQMAEKFPKYKDKFFRIYNPMEFEEIDKKGNLLKRQYFTHVSRIANDKDIKTVIDSYDLFIKNTKSPTLLYIIGDGCNLNFYKKYAAEKDCASQILFLGNQENPYIYMKYAMAVILSSEAEGLPCVLIEGLYLTKGVVVSSDCPNGPREILLDGKCGCLFPVGDAEKLAEIMQKIDAGDITRSQFEKYIPQSLERFKPKNIIDVFESEIIK